MKQSFCYITTALALCSFITTAASSSLPSNSNAGKSQSFAIGERAPTPLPIQQEHKESRENNEKHALRSLDETSILHHKHSQPAWAPIYLALAQAYLDQNNNTPAGPECYIRAQKALHWLEKARNCTNDNIMWLARALAMECSLGRARNRQNFHAVTNEINALLAQNNSTSAKQIAQLRRGQMYYLGQGTPFTPFNHARGLEILKNEASKGSAYTASLSNVHLAEGSALGFMGPSKSERNLSLGSPSYEARQLGNFILSDGFFYSLLRDIKLFAPRNANLWAKLMALKYASPFDDELDRDKVLDVLITQESVLAIRVAAYKWWFNHIHHSGDTTALTPFFDRLMHEELGLRMQVTEMILAEHQPVINSSGFKYRAFPANKKPLLENLLNSIEQELTQPSTSLTDRILGLVKLSTWYAENPALLFKNHRKKALDNLLTLLGTQGLDEFDHAAITTEDTAAANEQRMTRNLVRRLVIEQILKKEPRLALRIGRVYTITDALSVLRRYYKDQLTNPIIYDQPLPFFDPRDDEPLPLEDNNT